MATWHTRSLEKEWRTFVTWCENRGLQAVPSRPWTLAAYALSRETRCKPSDIRKSVTDIGKAHSKRARSRPDRADLVSRTLDIIEKRSEVRSRGAELFEEEGAPGWAKPGGDKGKHRKKAKKTGKRDGGGFTLRSEPKLVSRRRLDR